MRTILAVAVAAHLSSLVPAQPCTVSTLSMACGVDPYISRVRFPIGTTDNGSGCSPGSGYGDYHASFLAENWSGGGAYPIEVTVAAAQPSDNVTVWTDYDGSGGFDPAEATDLAPQGGGLYLGVVFVPYACREVLGARLRVSLARGLVFPQPACGPVTHGEREDYPVDIHPGGVTLCMRPIAGAQVGFQLSNGTPGGTYFAAFTANQGAYPHGYWFGIDIPMPQLFSEFTAGLPFVGTLDAAGGFTFSFPNPGLMISLFGVAVELTPGLTLGAATDPVIIVL